MSSPVQDTSHVAEGLGYVIGQYKGKANLAALLTSFLNRIQDLENVLWAVRNSQLLDNGPTGQALYQIADLLQCPQGTLTDAQLLFLVRVWILARKSKGRSEDLIAILSKAFGAGGFTYAESYPAAYEATVPIVPDVTLLAPLAQALRIARPPGVYGVLTWGTSLVFDPMAPDPSAMAPSFFFADASPSGALGSGLKDSYSGTLATGLLSAVGV